MSALLFKEDLLFIEQEVTRVLREELKTRAVFPVDTNFNPAAREIGYDIFDITGSAKIMALGGNAKDIPFVGEEKERKTQAVYNIVTGIRYEEDEIEAVQGARAMGKGSSFNLDAERPATARRFISEKETQVAFTGDAPHGIPGILDTSFYGASKGTKSTAVVKWDGTATPAQILADIRKLIKSSSKNGLFPGPKTVLLPFDQWFELSQPFNDGTESTILDWLQRSLPGQVNFEFFNMMEDANNGAFNTGNAMLVFTPRVDLVKLTVVQDIRMLTPVTDILENQELAIKEKTGGMVIKHPSSLSLMDGLT